MWCQLRCCQASEWGLGGNQAGGWHASCDAESEGVGGRSIQLGRGDPRTFYGTARVSYEGSVLPGAHT